MKQTYVFAIMIVLGMAMADCGNSSNDVVKLVAERDSLRQTSERQTAKLNDYMQTMDVLNATLDSIALQESMIFKGNGEVPVTKENVKHNLIRFEAILKEQEAKIRKLERLLSASKDSTNKSLQLIVHLKEQISVKNAQISRLKEELENKNVSMAQLQKLVESQKTTINSQSATIDELNLRTKRQGEALARQDAILNNGYVFIASKKELKHNGIIKKGRIVSNTVFDRTKFRKIDIRKWREVTFPAKRPRILTTMPSTSYEITTAGDGNFTLHIKNPTDFWNISNYLVIQTD